MVGNLRASDERDQRSRAYEWGIAEQWALRGGSFGEPLPFYNDHNAQHIIA